MITKRNIAAKLSEYLRRQLTLSELVDWAERAMLEGEFEEGDRDILRDIVARLGLADVKEFGLAWEDCEQYLARLGYQVSVEVFEVA